MSTPKHTKTTAEILYAIDPLCGWCYCFFPVVQQLQRDFANELRFTVLSGGLATGPRAAPLREHAEHIRSALAAIKQRTGVVFGKPFMDLLDEGSYMNDSEVPSIALTVAKRMRPEIQLDFAHTLQLTFFENGLSLNDQATYQPLAQQFGLDWNAFARDFASEEAKRRTHEEWRRVRELGVRSFPTLVLCSQAGIQAVNSGCESYAEVKGKLSRLVQHDITSAP